MTKVPVQTDSLEEVLERGNYVTAEDVKKAKEYSAGHGGAPLTEYLLAEGLLTKRLLGQALSESFHLPYADLDVRPPHRDLVGKINETVAKKYNLLLTEEGAREVTVATDGPAAEGLPEVLEKTFPGKKINLAYAPKEEITPFFKAYEEPLVMRIIEAIGGGARVAPEIIKQVFNDALTRHTSDIHFEPQEDEVVVRFRIDGVLAVVGKLPKETYENILTRIKIQARLRIDEHFAAQDGAIRFAGADGKVVDMRVSVVPTLDGETVAIRILLSYVKSLTLEELGLADKNRGVISEVSQRPFGMILVTGPTGSGKTTTLYSIIKTLNDETINITTIEDPVEYKIPRVNQIQVNPATNLTFAKGLRSIVRQDPNIILVGEIRDLETAEIAVNAALTGHLLLSTFHANDAATTIPRLLNMGVEPFMLASTLELIVAQRLVRKICPSCRASFPVKGAEVAKKLPGGEQYFAGAKNFYRGKGCSVCSGTGYQGRTAIFELIRVTPAMRELILSNPSVHQVEELARREGAVTMFEDGVDKVLNGVTSFEELVRVALPPVTVKEVKSKK
ncbi:MAG: GspE/PulE family protein [Microgenomates group bacterium]